MEEDRKTKVGNLRLAALIVAAAGGIFALATDTWRDGVLGLALSIGVGIFGCGERVKGRDRAVGTVLVIVGVIGAFGHLGRMYLAFFASG